MTNAEHSNQLIFFVNGKKVIEENAKPEDTLLYYLRNKLRLCGTKLGCGEGGCGACTVMISKFDTNLDKITHLAINACLTPVCAMHGFAVTTVEGIGSTKSKLHSVQERIAMSHGTQCGFCTPGMVMSMYALLRTFSKPTLKDIETALQGNLCRCTGYRPILEGFKTYTEEHHQNSNNANKNVLCSLGNKCCKCINNGETECGNHKENDNSLFNTSELAPYEPTQELIFPPDLKLLTSILNSQNLIFRDAGDVAWYRPTDLNTLLDLKFRHPDAKLIAGSTEIGIEMKFANVKYPIFIHITHVSELSKIRVIKDQGLEIGASVTLQNLQSALKEQIKLEPEYKTQTFVAMIEMLNHFAGNQIRNVATIGGNIMTASPVSDMIPVLIASKTQLLLFKKFGGIRRICLDKNFFCGYRQTLIDQDEVLVSVIIPFTDGFQYVRAYKQSKRRDDDIAIVNAAFSVCFWPNNETIRDIRIVYGGMAPTVIVSQQTEKVLIGRRWNSCLLEPTFNKILEDNPLAADAPGGNIEYRKSLTLSFFFKFYLSVLQCLDRNVTKIDKSATTSLTDGIVKSSQYFKVSSNRSITDKIGKPLLHASAFRHATGEAIYCDDIPKFENELYMAPLLSTRAHANILSIDASDALTIKGVRLFLSGKDLPDINIKSENDFVFVKHTVTSCGQILGIIIADNEPTSRSAIKKIKVEYEDLSPIIVSIEDAIRNNSYFFGYETPKILKKGDVDKVFAQSNHVIEGNCSTGTQEHFYLETQCTIVVPKEDDELEVFCSTQYPAAIAKLICSTLGINQNKVNVRVKRLGGGFGGKENQPAFIAVPAALAASILKKPIRCMLTRDEDMQITGARHPFYIKYKTAFNEDGKILACDVEMFANAGYSLNVSPFVLERAMFHFENVYKIPCVRVKGYLCKTNVPSNRAFRGFGAPQAMLAGESIVRSISEYLHRDHLEVARLNMYREGDLTPFNQIMEYCTIVRCWDECITSSSFVERRMQVEKYNQQNRWKKRGISVVPTKYGVAFHTMTKNQAGALVHVYTDGSVLLSHGGIEMGQGLHTKMIQIASRVLNISHSKIIITESSTDKVPNSSATAASISSDLNGMAVLNACETIIERLKPFKEENPNGTWEEWVSGAYQDRVSLSATGFYKTPFQEYNWNTNSGTVFHYFTFGAACSEVEIDCLTGDHQVLRTDIVMDVGESLNPALDVGQIEGAFMQGYGFFMLEEMMYGKDGSILTKGPSKYKIPSLGNLPREFNVSLLKGAPNPKAIYSSKAVGEPPLFLASSTLFAVREAVKAARLHAGLTGGFDLHAPLSPAKIRMGCYDHLTLKLHKTTQVSTECWTQT